MVSPSVLLGKKKDIYLLFPIINLKNIKVRLEDSRGKNSENT